MEHSTPMITQPRLIAMPLVPDKRLIVVTTPSMKVNLAMTAAATPTVTPMKKFATLLATVTRHIVVMAMLPMAKNVMLEMPTAMATENQMVATRLAPPVRPIVAPERRGVGSAPCPANENAIWL